MPEQTNREFLREGLRRLQEKYGAHAVRLPERDEELPVEDLPREQLEEMLRDLEADIQAAIQREQA